MSRNKSDKSPISIKMIVVGSVNVGKTSLLTRYATGNFQEVTKSTSNASFITKEKIVDKVKYEIKLWDTAGQEKSTSLTKIFTKDAKIAILVYSIDDEKSFIELKKWLNIVKETNDDNLILGVAANKADLYKNAVITDERGKKYAEEIGAVWKSTSSLLDDCGIDELVDILFKKYLESDPRTMSLSNTTIIITPGTENQKIKGGCCSGKNKAIESELKKKANKPSQKEVEEDDDF